MRFKNFRIIPRLDIKGPNLVKGIHLEGLRVLGAPSDFATHYYHSGADELFYMDVVASLYERNSLDELVSKTMKDVFIPLTVGGGLRNLQNITQVLRSGADKVCLNTAAIRNPDLISQAAKIYGSSTIVVAIEAIKQKDGRYLAYVDNAREETGVEVFEWASRAYNAGAGEIVITSVDKEGTGEGLDLELIRGVVGRVQIPVIAHGGTASPQDALNAYNLGASAITVASIFHYDYVTNRKDEVTADVKEGNTVFLKTSRSFGKIKSMSLKNFKQECSKLGLPIRMDVGNE